MEYIIFYHIHAHILLKVCIQKLGCMIYEDGFIME